MSVTALDARVLFAGYHYMFGFLEDAGVITVKENWRVTTSSRVLSLCVQALIVAAG